MRISRLAPVLAALCGCGEGAATPPKGPPTEVGNAPSLSRPAGGDDGAALLQASDAPSVTTAEAPPPPSAPAPTAPVGHLTGPAHLGHLFDALAALEGGRAHDDVRVLQYGDSHTAGDLGVAAFRKAVQLRFGDGGRGFVPLGRPWKGFGEDGVRGGMDKDFEPTKVKYRKGSFSGEGGCYGLLGVGVAADRAGARAWTDLAAHAPRLVLDYAMGPGGGSFDVFIDGANAGRVATRAGEARTDTFAFDVADVAHHVEARTVGDGEIRLFGVEVQRPEAGVVVSALGINGAQIFTPLRWGEACFGAELRHAAPDLVILAYGTNEALEPGLTDAAYERAYVDMLGRIARAVPTTSCLLLGPPDLARHTKGKDDWKTLPRVQELVALQRRVAEAAGCAFYDQMEAMGGEGAMARWASEPDPRGGHDRVHLTRTGYAELGTTFAGDLIRAYDDWRAARGLAPLAGKAGGGTARR